MAEEGAAMNLERERGREQNHEKSPLIEPLLKTSSAASFDLAMVGAKVSRLESLDYEIIENNVLKQDWRSKSREEILEYVFLKWTTAFLIGFLTGAVATLINLVVENITGHKMVIVSRLVDQDRYLAGLSYLTGVNLVLTFSAAILCVCIAPTAAGPGIPEIKAYLNGVDTPNMFGQPTLYVKIIGSMGAVASGMDLGKEGPLVHIGACIAAQLGRLRRHFDNDRDRRDLITMGSCSGVCAAFRAPIGGVLFALEEIATWWRPALLWRTFFSTAIVVVVLRAAAQLCSHGKCGMFGNGGLILYDVSSVEVQYHPSDLMPIVAIGVIGGVLGSLYNFLLHKVLRLYSLINEKGKMAKLLLALSVSTFTSICLFSLPFLAPCKPYPTFSPPPYLRQFNCPPSHYNDLATLLLSTIDDSVRRLFSTSTPNLFSPFSLLIFFLLYCILGLFTFGIAVPSGLFLPIILMGSSYGRLLAAIFSDYIQIDQGLYAVLGAAALMAGSMRMTVSLCVIFLELTNNLLLLPITMFVLLIAKSVGDFFNPSIYEIILDMKGLPFLHPNPEPWMRDLTVGELCASKGTVITVGSIEKVSKLVQVLGTPHGGFPVVDHWKSTAGDLQGLVLRCHVEMALKKKWFMREKRRAEEREVRELMTSDWREGDGEVTSEEMEMYVDLSPFVNLTAHSVVESTSVAKAAVLFRQVGLRHLLVLPKYPGPEVPPLVGILTRKDLRAENILSVFPHIASRKACEEGEKIMP